MNDSRTQRSSADDAATDGGSLVDHTPTELEPMNRPHETNSTEARLTDNDDQADAATWTTFGDILDRFAGDTSLLGVPRAILATSRLARLFWVVVCVTCFVMFIEGTVQQMIRYYQYPKQVTVELKSEGVSFPAVTLCNFRNLDFDVINRLNRINQGTDQPSRLDEYQPSDKFIFDYLKYVSNLTSIIDSDRYQTDPEVRVAVQEAKTRFAVYANSEDEMLSGAGIKLHQYVASCSLGGQPCNITRDFSRDIFHPYYFNCFTYRKPGSAAASEENTDDDLPWLMPGLDNGLSVVVLTGSGMVDKNKRMMESLPGLYDAGGALGGSDGVRVMIHSPDRDVAPLPLAEGFDVPPGFTASLSVRPRRNERIGPPHGDCIDHDPFIPATRSSQHIVYRQMLCQQRCLQHHIREKCHCVDESLPIEHPLTVLPCRNIEFPAQCSFEESDSAECVEALMSWYDRVKCAKQVRERVQANRAEMTRCQCRAACNELVYDVAYSMARWPAPGLEGDAVYDDIFNVNRFLDQFTDSQTIQRHFNRTGDRAKALQDFARINVYVADPEVLVTRESPEYEMTALISDIGGQLGLWIGASLITAAEIIEFVWNVINKFVDLRSCRRRHRPHVNHSATPTV